MVHRATRTRIARLYHRKIERYHYFIEKNREYKGEAREENGVITRAIVTCISLQSVNI